MIKLSFPIRFWNWCKKWQSIKRGRKLMTFVNNPYCWVEADWYDVGVVVDRHVDDDHDVNYSYIMCKNHVVVEHYKTKKQYFRLLSKFPKCCFCIHFNSLIFVFFCSQSNYFKNTSLYRDECINDMRGRFHQRFPRSFFACEAKRN